MVEVQGGSGSGPEAQQVVLRVEGNGINVIADAQRHGRPRQLFWPQRHQRHRRRPAARASATAVLATTASTSSPTPSGHGRPRQLLWPWFGANVSVLGLSYGAFALGSGISFAQALVAGVIGIVFSFLPCGFVALAGQRGSAPTMVLSRAAFGVRGNRLPAAISWLLTVGWETVLTILATLATSRSGCPWRRGAA